MSIEHPSIEMVGVSVLRPYARNARTHSRKQVSQIADSIRRFGFTNPVLMLTALADVEHRVAGLDAGADDSLPKPFAFEELLARLRALLRRAAEAAPEAAPAGHQAVHLRLGRVHLDAAGRRATAGDTTLPLRDKELRLLEVLLRHAGEVVSRTRLAERVWGSAFDVTDNAIDVTASGLRLKLADADPGVTIETVRGVGYRIVGA